MPYKHYKKLDRAVDYDVDAVNELAEALNEITEHERRAAELKELVNENPDLHNFVWRTADGTVYAIGNLEDDHFENVLKHLARNGRPIKRELRAEARKRGIKVPRSDSHLLTTRTTFPMGIPPDPIEGEVITEDDDWSE